MTQFPLLEDALGALGVAVWPMVELEADDAMASAAAVAQADPRVERVLICTPDKDLAQCVEDPLVVQVDRRREGTVIDEAGVRAKFGVGPRLDPRLPRAGRRLGRRVPRPPGLGREVDRHRCSLATSTSTRSPTTRATGTWTYGARPSSRSTLAAARDAANLFLDLATLRTHGDVGVVDDWEWHGPEPELEQWAERLGAETLVGRATRLAEQRS